MASIGEILSGQYFQMFLWNAAKIAFVVGTLLNVINQGGTILDGGRIMWGNIALNYLVPFCVSAYSAIKSLAGRRKFK